MSTGLAAYFVDGVSSPWVVLMTGEVLVMGEGFEDISFLAMTYTSIMSEKQSAIGALVSTSS